MRVLIDTHVLAWSLVDPDRLEAEARLLIESGVDVHVPPAALHEIALKIRKGDWPEMSPHLDRLDALCRAQGFRPAPYTFRMAMLAGSLDWAHRDPFDRMIAATAIEMRCALISKDSAFDGLAGLPGWSGRVWNSASRIAAT